MTRRRFLALCGTVALSMCIGLPDFKEQFEFDQFIEQLIRNTRLVWEQRYREAWQSLCASEQNRASLSRRLEASFTT